MKVIITGATGMVGKGVLIECLESNVITEVLSISRRSLNMNHPKLKELIHKDFSEFESIKSNLKKYDACFACMGVSAAGLKENEYYKLTYLYTLSLAKTLYSLNPNMIYTYVSGQGTDSSEKGKSMWARVKGKTENDLIKLGFIKAYMFRPGAIIPVKGVIPSSKLYRVTLKYLGWLIKLIKLIVPNAVVNSAQIGKAMIQLTQKEYPKTIIDPKDILKLVE